MVPGYESFFGVVERAFSLTPDIRYHYRSRAHARALGGLSTGLARTAPLLLLSGEFGTGKSTLCRTVMRARRDGPAIYIANALLTPEELHRRLLNALAGEDPAQRLRTDDLGREELGRRVEIRLRARAGNRPLVVIDEAHLLPPSTIDTLLGLAALEHERQPLVQILLAAQPASNGLPGLPRIIQDSVSHQARLTPLERDECEPYIQHRLQVAGGGPIGIRPHTIDTLFAVSGGVPRLVNLLCERALQEAAALGLRRLEPSMFEAAARALELLRLRSRRFRWFGVQRGAAAL